MYFAGDTVYKFFRVVLIGASVGFCFFFLRAGQYDLTIDYVRALVAWAIGAVAYGFMWVAKEFY